MVNERTLLTQAFQYSFIDIFTKIKLVFSETQTAHVLFPFADFYIYSVITSSVKRHFLKSSLGRETLVYFATRVLYFRRQFDGNVSLLAIY